MRLLLAALTVVSALFVSSLAATAQPIKQVEVTNFPDPQNVTGSVEVTNFPAAPTPSRFQLVGFTSDTFTGDTGVLGFTLACQQVFDGSRMCMSTEVMETVTVPASLTGAAWVRPMFVSFFGAGTQNLAKDASGRTSLNGRLSCVGWEDENAAGLRVDSHGAFSTSNCTNAHSVACCAPVP